MNAVAGGIEATELYPRQQGVAGRGARLRFTGATMMRRRWTEISRRRAKIFS
ncbi:MAG TPA: hypothetical protein VGZ00_10860 [Candidatus Baltobacteraceae bacterium]|nr:hypothetical protein [Candidatus Baltobacteraceae bacterium]